ncbi:MAG: GNAT family N-acetyltransferase [Anaerolineales bacterium]|nr:GNAT family N-acetyltransferase [Anaerolineales bacterium]
MILGERIRLRAVEQDDLERYVTWFNDPEVRKHLEMILPMSSADEEDWYQNMRKSPPAERAFAIDIRDGNGWTHIGSCSFLHVDQINSLAEIGISIGEKKQWGKGYGTEVVRLLLKVAFETLNLNRVYLRVYEKNMRGIRTYEKAGFVLEGRLREARFSEGSYQDVLIMGVLRSEWTAGKEKRG